MDFWLCLCFSVDFVAQNSIFLITEEKKCLDVIIMILSAHDEISDRCKGTVIGAWLGDAIGAVLEFQGIPDESAIQNAFNLPGGGLHHVGPGQITDDGELTCCLLQGLYNTSVLDLNLIASLYGN